MGVPAEVKLDHIPAAPLMREGDESPVSDLGSLLAELYIIAAAVEQERVNEVGGVTRREMLLRDKQFCYANTDGVLTPYVEVFKTSKQTYAGNAKLVERFDSEEIVWSRAADLANTVEMGGGVVIISPPRDIYRFPGEQALSATFILKKVDHDRFVAYSLYIPEISEQEHMKIVGLSAGLSGNSVLETPISISEVDMSIVVEKLGFADWEEVERRAVCLGRENSMQDRGVFRALLQLNERFKDQQNIEFRLVFADMIRDLLLKDVLGKFTESGEDDIYQEGLLYLRAKTVGQLNYKLAWIFGCEGIDDRLLDTWVVEQQLLQQQAVYRAMWGGHGNGSSMLSFDDKNKFIDSRANMLMDTNRGKGKGKGECKKCHGKLDGEGKCEHCSK